jgi:hypothetical protein
MNDPRLKNVKWFSFGDPEDIGNGSIVDLAVFLNPKLRPFVLPAGTFGKLTPEPVVTLAVDNLLVASTALDALEAGFGDIAFAPNTGSYREGISTIIPLYPSVLHIVADKDRPADSLEELLRGAVVYAGPQGSTPWSLANKIVDGFEFAPGEVSFANNQDVAPDVIVLYAPIDRDRVMNDPRLKDVKWFSFGDPEDIGNGSIVDLAVFLNPRLRPFVLPAGTFGNDPIQRQRRHDQIKFGGRLCGSRRSPKCQQKQTANPDYRFHVMRRQTWLKWYTTEPV